MFQLRDGSDSSAPLLGRYCSMSQGFISVNSSSNTLWVRFRSDWSQAGRGFKAQYHTSKLNLTVTSSRYATISNELASISSVSANYSKCSSVMIYSP